MNGCSLISEYSQKMPTINPQMALPEQVYLFIFFLGTFRVSTLGCCKYILFFFEFEIRTKPYANYKTDILE